jgi:thiosulfate dehydrogenase [quinone] large subunit
MAVQSKTPAAAPADETAGQSWYRDFVPSGAWRGWGAVARILLGFTFLWAFLDKAFGLGYTTKSASAWVFGTGDGSPTYGFLKFGTNPEGPFASTFNGMAYKSPTAFWNWLFMFALVGVGVAFILGIFMRLAAVGGSFLLFLMYLAEAPWAKYTDASGATVAGNNPIIDDHIIYGVVMIMLALFMAGNTWGLGKVWAATSLVKSQPWLA